MITKEQFERFRDFYATLRPLIIEKFKEKYEIERSRPLSEKEEIIDIEYSLDDGVFLVTTDESYSCGHDTNYYNVEPKYLYDSNAMQELKIFTVVRVCSACRKELNTSDYGFYCGNPECPEYDKEMEESEKTDRELETLNKLAAKYGFDLVKMDE